MRKKRKTLLPKRIAALFLCFLVMLTTGCGQNQAESKVEREIFAMDTVMKLTFYGSQGEKAMQEAVHEVYRLENLFSVTKKDSDIAKINAASGTAVRVEKETYELIEQCKKYGDRTEGLFDISVYPLVRLWGFTTEQYHVPSEEERETALKKVDYRKIELFSGNQVRIAKGMAIDLGAVAKGYLSQHIMSLCREQGVDSAIVSLGGNVQTMGVKPDGNTYVVGITDPSDGAGIYGTMKIKDKAVITSGIYQRNFTEGGTLYHHIMDKRSGMPAENNLASVTVMAEDGAEADALATALYVMGEEKAKAYQKTHAGLQLILIRKDGSFWQSAEAGMEKE